MRIKKKNVARLASLSALGAGALGVAAGTAQAGIVSYTYPSPETVGPGHLAKLTILLPGTFHTLLWGSTSQPLLRILNWNETWNTGTSHGVSARGSGARFRGQGSGGILSIVGAGQKWGTSHAAAADWVIIASRGKSSSGPWQWGNPSFPTPSDPNQYALFQFLSSGSTLYGWLQLSNAVSPTSGPDVTVYGYAYDTVNGEQIGAGDTGGVPEPSTMALTGLAALALGATGLRRWRAARKPAA